MVRGLNKVQIIGHLGRDPELRATPAGTAVANFTVAVNRTRKDPAGQLVEETEWFRVVVWEKLAETCHQYLAKGDPVYVEGRLQSRKYTDREGIERTAVELVANVLLMLGGRGEPREAPGAVAASARGQRQPGTALMESDDDLPF